MCEPITLDETPESVMLSPITDELTEEQVLNLDTGSVSLDRQGLIRDCSSPGIRLTPWRPEKLRNIDLLKTSHVEHTYLTGESSPLQSLRAFSRNGVKTTIITLGGNGSIVNHEDTYLTVPVYSTDLLDPTGAGDSFLATVHDRLASGEPVEWALAYGSAVASGVIETIGPDFKLSKKEVTSRAEHVMEGIQKRT
jgi:sugar/nucleoside kinase (ribokinase family)